MPEELPQNPYEATGNADKPPQERRWAHSARWIFVPIFMLSGSVLTAIAAFIFVEVIEPSGDFTEMIALGYAFIGMIVGGVIGAVVGIAFASCGRHR